MQDPLHMPPVGTQAARVSTLAKCVPNVLEIQRALTPHDTLNLRGSSSTTQTKPGLTGCSMASGMELHLVMMAHVAQAKLTT